MGHVIQQVIYSQSSGAWASYLECLQVEEYQDVEEGLFSDETWERYWQLDGEGISMLHG
jgi:hypothetical protein